MDKLEYTIALKFKGFSDEKIRDFFKFFNTLNKYFDADDAFDHLNEIYQIYSDDLETKKQEINEINERIKELTPKKVKDSEEEKLENEDSNADQNKEKESPPVEAQKLENENSNANPDEEKAPQEVEVQNFENEEIVNLKEQKRPIEEEAQKLDSKIRYIEEAAEFRADFYIARFSVRDEVRPSDHNLARVGEDYLRVKDEYDRLPLISRIFAHILPKSMYEPAKTLDVLNTYEKMFKKFNVPEREYESPNFRNFVNDHIDILDPFEHIADETAERANERDARELNSALNEMDLQDNVQERLKNDLQELNNNESVSENEFNDGMQNDNFFEQDSFYEENSIDIGPDDFDLSK